MKTSILFALLLLHTGSTCALADNLAQTTEPAPRSSTTQFGGDLAGVAGSEPLQTAPAVLGSGNLVQPQSISGFQAEVVPPGMPADLTIDGLIQFGLANNPAVAQAAARVDALRGRWVQAGLPPNPTVGYLGSEIGNDGRGGQNGGFAGQEFVTGGKLRLDRAVVAQEIQRAEQQLAATQLRLTTDVRKAAYAVLVAQRRVELAENLTELSAGGRRLARPTRSPRDPSGGAIAIGA